MPNPKKKISRSIRGMRRSHNDISQPAVHNCSNCGSMKAPHHVCASCGYYNGKEVVAAKA